MILRPRPEPVPEGSNRFAPGALVRHKRYGYRGVVAAVDLCCEADDKWYLSNQTQPPREQPWYHVLVHGGAHATYAAESNLEPELAPAPIVHPLVGALFSGFDGERYERNDTPWPPA